MLGACQDIISVPVVDIEVGEDTRGEQRLRQCRVRSENTETGWWSLLIFQKIPKFSLKL